MTKLGRHKVVDRGLAERYHRVGDALLESATLLADIADDDQFGNGIAIIAIHAAIAWADTLTIAYAGSKSTDGDHARAADLVQDALGALADASALKALRSALAKKDAVSYSGTYYRLVEAQQLSQSVRTFCEWAEKTYARQPRRS